MSRQQFIFIKMGQTDDDASGKVSCPFCDEEFPVTQFFKLGDHARNLHAEFSEAMQKYVYKCSRQHCKQTFTSLKDVVEHNQYIQNLHRFKQTISEQLEADTESSNGTNFAMTSMSATSTSAIGDRQNLRYECRSCRLMYTESTDFFAHYEDVHHSDQGLLLSAPTADARPGQVLLEIGLPASSDEIFPVPEPVFLDNEQHSIHHALEETFGYPADQQYLLGESPYQQMAAEFNQSHDSNGGNFTDAAFHPNGYQLAPNIANVNSSFDSSIGPQNTNYGQYVDSNMSEVGTSRLPNDDAVHNTSMNVGFVPYQFSQHENTSGMSNANRVNHGDFPSTSAHCLPNNYDQSNGRNVYQPYEASHMTYEYNNVLVGGMYGNRIVKNVSWGMPDNPQPHQSPVPHQQSPVPHPNPVPSFQGAVMQSPSEADRSHYNGLAPHGYHPNNVAGNPTAGRFISNGAFYDFNFHNALYNARQACENLCPPADVPPPPEHQRFAQQPPQGGRNPNTNRSRSRRQFPR